MAAVSKPTAPASPAACSWHFSSIWQPCQPDTPEDHAAPPTAASETALPRPSFDFYELLPQSEPDLELPGRNAPEPTASAGRTQYVLQAGSFRDPADADRRRAELLLLGLEPAVEPTDADNGRWYRVLLGPFDRRSDMARARSLTAQQDIDTLLMRRSAGDA